MGGTNRLPGLIPQNPRGLIGVIQRGHGIPLMFRPLNGVKRLALAVTAKLWSFRIKPRFRPSHLPRVPGLRPLTRHVWVLMKLSQLLRGPQRRAVEMQMAAAHSTTITPNKRPRRRPSHFALRRDEP